MLHHENEPADVTGDGAVSPIDALTVIQRLSQSGQCPLGTYVDVSNDQHVSPIDAVLVLQELDRRKVAAIAGSVAGEVAESEGDDSLTPELPELSPVTVEAGAAYHVPLQGRDPEGGPLTYTVTSSRDELKAELITGRNLVIDVEGFGKMVFRLFESEAPRVVERITRLANEGFYNGLTFHRILDDFVIQGGDPNGNGSGGSSLPDFDDQFDIDLVHNRTGVLSMAKSSDDTNNSQFFITEGPQRHLDFNHSIFGQLIEGESVREAISEVSASRQGVPTTPVVMKTVTVEEDSQNALLRLSSSVVEGSGTVTVRATDQAGRFVERTLQVTLGPEIANGAPYLADIPAQVTVFGTVAQFQLSAIDAEGDAPQYSALLVSGEGTVTVDANSGQVTVEPADDYVGDLQVRVRVRQTAATTTRDTFDQQLVTVSVEPPPPSLDGLTISTDTGVSNTDRLTNLRQVTVVVSGVLEEAELTFFRDQLEVATTEVTEGNRRLVTFEVPADGLYDLSAQQTVGNVSSDVSSPISIEVDTQPPSAAFGSVPSTVRSGETLIGQFEHVDEMGAKPIRYVVLEGPAGATIDAQNGTLTWNTTGVAAGNYSMTVGVQDPAGNTTSSQHAVSVTAETPVPPAPVVSGLTIETDTGVSSTDGVTNRLSVTLLVTNVEAGGQVSLFHGEQALTLTSVPIGTNRLVTVQFPAAGVYEIVARQTVEGVTSVASSSYRLEIDTTPPPAALASVPATVEEGGTLVGEFDHVDEMGLVPIRYKLMVAPAAATIDAQTGRLTWPSINAAPGSYLIRVGVEDLAGNVTSSDHTVTVVAAQSSEGANLVEFAQGLAAAGVTLYGAKWDAATTTQRALFDDGQGFLPFVDVTANDRSRLPVADSEQINVFPTWVFADGSRLEGQQSLTTLSQRAGVALGGSASPLLVSVPNATVLTGSPMQYSLDGYSPSGSPLTYTIQSDDPTLVQATIGTGTRALQLDIGGYGRMQFHLFDQEVPQLTQAITDRVASGFYNGLQWYQVNERWLQTGDAADLGLGTGMERTFDDQFHEDLQHNRPGVLSLPKLVDDGNGSHFMVTQRQQRQLDFHQSIFGVQVEGDAVRAAIGETVTHVGGRTRFPITINQARVVEDRENAVALLKPVSGATGTTTVRVTVTDSQGNSQNYSFQVTVVADTVNSSPYLTGYSLLNAGTDEDDDDEENGDGIQTIQLTSFDVEGDAVDYFARAVGDLPFDVTVDDATGMVTVHRPTSVTGSLELLVGVGPMGKADAADPMDRQRINL